ncbi:hypothetical protein [Vibrio phage vB_VhaS-a]|nr:hypothetical protein [Vibrio phage vB_VhaS-a]
MLTNKSLGLTPDDLKALRERFAANLFKRGDPNIVGQTLDLTRSKIKEGQEFYILDLANNVPRKVVFYSMFRDDCGYVAVMRGRGFETFPNFLKTLLSSSIVPSRAFYLTYDEALDGLKEHHERALKAIESLRSCNHG